MPLSHWVSTAYVCGKRCGLIRECELDCGQQFWNSYEKSKFEAEQSLTAFCRDEKVPLVIVRPSIIINHRETGRASTFTHLNALVEIISRIQQHFGIRDGQVISTVIRLMADPEARPNLPYMNSRCDFDLSNTRSIVPGYDRFFTPLNVDYIEKVISFQRR